MQVLQTPTLSNATDLLTIVEALRANRDVGTCLHGLNAFRRMLRAGGTGQAAAHGGGGSDPEASSCPPQAARFLLSYIAQSPNWEELQCIWDVQLTVSSRSGRTAAE